MEDNSFFDGGKYNYENNDTGSGFKYKKILVIVLGFSIIILLLLSTLKITGVMPLKDNNAPIIYMSGNKTIDLIAGQSYNDYEVKAIDKEDGDISNKIEKIGNVDTSREGIYIITYKARDKAGNETVKTRTVVVQSKDTPVIVFTPNGSDIASEKYSVIVKITPPDNTTIVTSKYQWTISSEKPIVSSFVNDATETINSPENVNGNYYLWIYAKDSNGREKILGSNVFKIGITDQPKGDTTPPVISFLPNGNSSVSVTHSTTVSITDDSNITVMKYMWSKDTNAPSKEAIEYTLNNNSLRNTPSGMTGTYYLWVYAEDEKGNSMITSSKGFTIDANLGGNTIADKTAPTCTTNGGSNSWFSTDRTIKINCSDTGGSGVLTCAGLSGTSVSKTYTTDMNQTYTYNVTDKAGNTGTCTALVRIDKTAPSITYTPNGNSSTLVFQNAKVAISDQNNIKVSKYRWTTSTSMPALSEFTNFTNGSTISSPTGPNATYYLWIYAEDTLGNSTTMKSNAYVVKNFLNDKYFVGAFTIGTYYGGIKAAENIKNAGAMGFHLTITYARPYLPDSTDGKALQDNSIQQIDGVLMRYLMQYVCIKEKSSWAKCDPDYFKKLTVPVATPTNDTEFINVVKDYLNKAKENNTVAGYWLLDDWGFNTNPKNLLILMNNAIHDITPDRKSICGFGAHFQRKSDNNAAEWDSEKARYFSAAGCDMIGLYIYARYGAQGASDWTMPKVLKTVLDSLKANGWDKTKTPLIGIPQAIRTSQNYSPTKQEMITQTKTFCENGANGIIYFAWVANDHAWNLWNDAQLRSGASSGMYECRNIWRTR